MRAMITIDINHVEWEPVNKQWIGRGRVLKHSHVPAYELATVRLDEATAQTIRRALDAGSSYTYETDDDPLAGTFMQGR